MEISQERIERVVRAVGFEYFEYPDNEWWIFKPSPSFESIEIYGSRWIAPDGTAALVDSPDFPNDICGRFLFDKRIAESKKTVNLQGYICMIVFFVKGGRSEGQLRKADA